MKKGDKQMRRRKFVLMILSVPVAVSLGSDRPAGEPQGPNPRAWNGRPPGNTQGSDPRKWMSPPDPAPPEPVINPWKPRPMPNQPNPEKRKPIPWYYQIRKWLLGN